MKVPLVALLAVLLCVCGNLNPVYQNTAAEPTRSILPKSGYDVAFIEFGEQGSYQERAPNQSLAQPDG